MSFPLGQPIPLQFVQSDGLRSTSALDTQVSDAVGANNAVHLGVNCKWGTGVLAGKVVIYGSPDASYTGTWATLMVCDFADDNGNPDAPIAAPKMTQNTLAADCRYSMIKAVVVGLTAAKTVDVTLHLLGANR